MALRVLSVSKTILSKISSVSRETVIEIVFAFSMLSILSLVKKADYSAFFTSLMATHEYISFIKILSSLTSEIVYVTPLTLLGIVILVPK